jgi:hypothetical protein
MFTAGDLHAVNVIASVLRQLKGIIASRQISSAPRKDR